jgi:flagellin
MVTSVNPSLISALSPQNRPANQTQDALQADPTGRTGASQSNAAAVYAGSDGSPSLSAVLSAQDSLNRAASLTDVGLAAGGSIADLLDLAGQKASAAAQTSDPGQVASLNGDFQTLLQTIDQIAGSASFQGVTMLNGGASQDFSVQAGLNGGAPVSLSFPDLTTSGPVLGLSGADLTGGADAIASVIDQINRASGSLSGALGQMQSQSDQIQGQLGLVGQLQDVLAGGAGQSDSAEAAQLQALQVQQGLIERGGAIGNQAPQALLSLFRG